MDENISPPSKTHICLDCLPKFYSNSETRRKDLGECIECGLKTVGCQYDPVVLRRDLEQ